MINVFVLWLDDTPLSRSVIPSPDETSYLPVNWPVSGRVEFKQLCLKYASSADLVLKNVTFKAPAGHKIGQFCFLYESVAI